MSTWQGTVTNGYTIDKAGGDSILVFNEPSMYSVVITTMNVGDLGTFDSTTLYPDGRVWFHYVNPFASPPEDQGWVVGSGNTGIPYVTPLDSGLSRELNQVFGTKYPLPLATPIPTNPLSPEMASVNTPTTTVELTTYNSLPPSIPPVAEVPAAGASKLKNYTEGVAPLTTGVTIEHGGIKLVNGVSTYALFKDYLARNDVINSFDIIKKNFNIYPNSDIGSLKSTFIKKFNRFKTDYPDFHLSKTFSHVFITRPDLNIYKKKLGYGAWHLVDNLVNDPTFYYLDQSDQELMTSLTADFSGSHDLNPFLSNLAASFEISDEYIKTIEHGETLTGYKIQYGRHNIESRTAGSFNINYTDDKNLSVYKLHKAWVEYISRVYRGALAPRHEYIQKKVLDYASSVYYFVCGPDGETILFWAKYYGVFPTNTPSSANSWSKGSMVKVPDYSIAYSYSTKEDYNPAILVEFNQNSRGSFEYKKMFIPELGQSGTSFSGNPFVESYTDQDTRETSFKLRFRE